MYSQGNQDSASLLTQPFHPTTEDQFNNSQVFLEDPQQQQQQQQYSTQDALQEQYKYQLFQDYDQTLGNLSLNYDMNMIGSGALFDLASDNAWLEQQEQTTALADSQNIAQFPNDQIPNRAQTPGPIPRNIPNYLTARRRSLSADNIHAIAKAHASNRKIIVNAQQPQQQQQLESQFGRVPTAITMFSHDPGQFAAQTIKQENAQEAIQYALMSAGSMAFDHRAFDSDAHSIDSSNDDHQSNMSSPTQSQMEPINHAQRLSAQQARFKVKLDKRNQRSMPNIHVPNLSKVMLQQGGAATPLGMPGMEVPGSASTPNTPTFSPNHSSSASPTIATTTINNNNMAPTTTTTTNNNNSNANTNNGKPTPPRRGHMRKRSLSAPTQPFNLPNPAPSLQSGVPLQPAQQQYPFNLPVSSSFRRPGALPIQIQRSHKSSHTSAPMSSEEYQRKLDEELEKIDFNDITVSELKDMLRQRGKPATGKKAVLMQRLQEEYEMVKAIKHNNQQNANSNNSNANNNNSVQYSQMISPTSPSGVSLHRSIANLHISSPPAHTRRFSPYGSVSIPSSPRMIPTGMANNRATSNFSNGEFPFPGGVDEWHFKDVGIVHHPTYVSQVEDSALDGPMMLLDQPAATAQQQQQQPPQEFYGMQQPSSAPATTTEFDAPAATTEFDEYQQQQQPPSSAPPMTTEFVSAYDLMRLDTMNPMVTMGVAMNMNDEMIRMGGLNISSVTADNILMKPESVETSNKAISDAGLIQFDEAHQQQQLLVKQPGFEFDSPQPYLPMSATQQDLEQLQLRLQQQQQQQQQHW